MNSLSFTLQHRRSTKTLRVHYGLEGMKYIIQIYEGEINGHGEKECLPTEFQYEFEQEMLKHVHEIKKDLREMGWIERESPEVSQISFLRTDLGEDEVSNRFEWGRIYCRFDSHIRNHFLSKKILIFLILLILLNISSKKVEFFRLISYCSSVCF